MTTARNTSYAENFFREPFPNAAGNTINQGDFVYEDQSTHDVKALDSDAHAAYCVGVADSTYPFLTEVTGPLYINVKKFTEEVKFLKSGDTFTSGCACYYGTDAQSVSITGNYMIGTFVNLPDASQKSLLGTGTNTGIIKIQPRWPLRAILGQA